MRRQARESGPARRVRLAALVAAAPPQLQTAERAGALERGVFVGGTHHSSERTAPDRDRDQERGRAGRAHERRVESNHRIQGGETKVKSQQSPGLEGPCSGAAQACCEGGTGS